MKVAISYGLYPGINLRLVDLYEVAPHWWRLDIKKLSVEVFTDVPTPHTYWTLLVAIAVVGLHQLSRFSIV